MKTKQSNSKATLALLCLASGMSSLAVSRTALGQTRYTASWTSLDKHNPAPDWFKDAKFGIYYHWGAFGTAMFGTEWYPRNMFNKKDPSGEYTHHMATYGDPYGDWGYDKFLKGANDKSGKFVQFAPKLKSAGGAWDPDEWAQMFADAGARFAGPVAEHHDGFSMWDSKVNEWNSLAMGPKLNMAKLHADAIRKKGMRLFMSLHHEWNFGGYWANGTPSTTDPSLQKLYGKLPNADEQVLWLGKLKEVIDEFLPDILYQDRYVGAISQANQMAFLEHYYNAALDAGTEVVAVAKEGITDHPGQLYDYERGGPADIRKPYWMTDDSVGSQSWCYVAGLSYYKDEQFIGAFIDRVSKGGNMILNMSPLPDGSFPQRQKDILAAFGKFLKQMGTAIYSTQLFDVYGEGPTKMGGGEFTSPTALTASDIRYTKSKDGDAVYALLGGWPGNGKVVNMTAVTTARFPLGSGKVYLFGPTGGAAIELTATQDGSGLHVTLPATQPYTALAYAIKISKSGTVPAPTPWVNGSANPDGGVPPADGGSVPRDAGSGSADGPAGSGGVSGTGGTGGTVASGAGTSGTSSRAGGTGGGAGASSETSSSSSSRGGSAAGGTSTIKTSTSQAGASAGSKSSETSAAGGSSTAASVATGGHGSAGSSGHAGATSTGTDSAAGSSSGCSCAISGRNGHEAGTFLGLGIAIALLMRRRRRSS
jgi:alpha-L-fucosidase